MHFLKYFFLIIFLVEVIRAQDSQDSQEDNDDDVDDVDLEAVDELPSTESLNFVTPGNQETNGMPEEFTTTEKMDQTTEVTTEQTATPLPVSDGTQDTTEAKEESKQTNEAIEDKTETVVIFQEVEAVTGSDQLKESVPTITVVTSNGSDHEIAANHSNQNESKFSFSCYGRPFGQYADVQQDCHVFHLCYPYFNATTNELLYQRVSFLCDNDSVFDQKRFVCVDNSTVDHKCTDSEALYIPTNQEYLIRVFSQTTATNSQVKSQETDTNSNGNSNWFQWYRH